ncbi:MAG: Mth938-like domain-containing protein [Rhodospirillales bacterium]|nr:Mth938-like domain-containing protein [Rhodospirillales bacterium]
MSASSDDQPPKPPLAPTSKPSRGNRAAGLQIVERYGGGGFKVSGVRYEGSVLVGATRTLAWPAARIADLSDLSSGAPVESLAGFLESARPRLLIIGCGPRLEGRSTVLDAQMRQRGVAVEWMDTGAACRTFNVLALEGREVAAALIAVD